MDKSIYHALSGRWLISIILMMPNEGSRFTPLQNDLKISPSRLVDNLEKLEKMNIVKHLSSIERRHPLLPEYSFTEEGLNLKNELLKLRTFEDSLPFFIYEKWTLLVLLSLSKEKKFNKIKTNLAITPRVLSERLQKLIDLSLVDKRIESVSPLEVNYILKKEYLDIGLEISHIIKN